MSQQTTLVIKIKGKKKCYYEKSHKENNNDNALNNIDNSHQAFVITIYQKNTSCVFVYYYRCIF